MEKGNSTQIIDFNQVLTDGETLIWKGKPHKTAYTFHRFLTMLPIALIWGAFDGAFIAIMIGSGEIMEMLWFIIPFFAIHLAPVWIWLGSILTAKRTWKNTQYAITDKRIIIQTGFIGMNYKTIYYKEIKNVHLNIGVVDKLFGVGNIYFDTTGMGSIVSQVENSQASPRVFQSIENAYELYTKFQKIVMDIQTDIEYPNKLRPDTNPGYNTKYDDRF